MAKSNDEIYDLLVQIDKTLSTHKAATEVRLNHLEARAARPWQLWLAVAGSLVALPVAVWAALQGVSA
jgi:hypothetical protein